MLLRGGCRKVAAAPFRSGRKIFLPVSDRIGQ